MMRAAVPRPAPGQNGALRRFQMKIDVIGAGISGLAFARAMQQAGVPVEVHEAAPELRSIGGGLIVPPNSARILDRLGLGSVLDTQSVPVKDMLILDAKGPVLYRRDQHDVARQHGRGLHAITRTALHRALAGSLTPGSIHTRQRLTGLTHDAHFVTAEFASGERLQTELLVAAEGRVSRARALLMPEAQLVSTGQIAYRGLTRIEPFAEYRNSFVEYWGQGRRFTFFRIAPDLTYWHAPILSAPGETRKKTDLLREYRDFPDQVIELIAHTQDEHINSVELNDIDPLPHWYRGRVALIGDAAHATTPNLVQGAAQAIQDAHVLAEQLLTGQPLSLALPAYQAARERTANDMVAQARQIWQIGQARGVGRLLRNLTMKISPELARQRIEAFYE